MLWMECPVKCQSVKPCVCLPKGIQSLHAKSKIVCTYLCGILHVIVDQYFNCNSATFFHFFSFFLEQYQVDLATYFLFYITYYINICTLYYMQQHKSKFIKSCVHDFEKKSNLLIYFLDQKVCMCPNTYTMIAFLAFQPNLSWNDLDNLEFIFGQISEGERFCNLVFENKGEGRGEMLLISFVSTLSKKSNLQFFW